MGIKFWKRRREPPDLQPENWPERLVWWSIVCT
jgi:hypothetical protein